MATVGTAYARARTKLALKAHKILADTCRLIVGEEEYEDVPCSLKGGSGSVDGASYRIELPWDSPAVVGADVVVDSIEGRPQLTLQLVEPVDSSTGLWQEWKATAGPAFGRADIGL
jgi:hypothetical protein